MFPGEQSTTSYKVRVSSRHPHVADRIRSLLTTSDHNEKTLAENEYELYECSDEVTFISLSRHDQLQTLIEYEVDEAVSTHNNFVKALTGFPNTSVRILDEHAI